MCSLCHHKKNHMYASAARLTSGRGRTADDGPPRRSSMLHSAVNAVAMGLNPISIDVGGFGDDGHAFCRHPSDTQDIPVPADNYYSFLLCEAYCRRCRLKKTWN